MFDISQILTTPLTYGIPKKVSPYGDCEFLEITGYGRISQYSELVETPEGVVNKSSSIVICDEKVQVGWVINGEVCYKVEPYIAPQGEILRKAYTSSTKLKDQTEGIV